jgi:hypothetical protein
MGPTSVMALSKPVSPTIAWSSRASWAAMPSGVVEPPSSQPSPAHTITIHIDRCINGLPRSAYQLARWRDSQYIGAMSETRDVDVDAFVAAAEAAAEFFESIVADPGRLALLDTALRTRLKMAAGQVVLPDKTAKRQFAKARRRLQEQAVKAADLAVLARTGFRRGRAAPVFETPPALLDAPIDVPEDEVTPGRTTKARICYICKDRYHEIHHFYDHRARPARSSIIRSASRRAT